ncbi:MAG TPA: DUF4097 family beta strand repeat-containing protein [Blastocatellia bacterium]|nr:DUF4097 family beta strand repeat-containing protein [Blastocatellia bacterium]
MITRRSLLLAFVVLGAALAAALTANSQSYEAQREESSQTFKIAPNGRLSLKNINGSVSIRAWDNDTVKVDTVKHAFTKERLDEARVEIEATADAIHIETKYTRSSMNWTDDERGRYNNPASVEYTITVPRGVELDGIDLINGDLSLAGLQSEVRASSVNGRVTAENLTGRVKLTTVNGLLEATFDQLPESRPVSLSSVNGQVVVTLPSDANARLNASTVHGGISNDLGLRVKRGKHVGRNLAAIFGSGGARVELSNVNGGIEIRRAADGRPLSPIQDLIPERQGRDDEDSDTDGGGWR